MGWITTQDFAILDWIRAHLQSSAGDAFFSRITHLGDGGVFWIVLTVLFLILPKTRRLGLCLALGLILDALLCNVLIKPLVGRIRPYDLRPQIELLVSAPSDFSFPSGHTAVSFAAVAALWRAKSRLWIAALVLALLIAFSRLYLYLHYPTDVLGGMVVGAIAGLLGAQLGLKILKSGKADRLFPPSAT